MDHKPKIKSHLKVYFQVRFFCFGLLNSPTARAGDYEAILQDIDEEILHGFFFLFFEEILKFCIFS